MNQHGMDYSAPLVEFRQASNTGELERAGRTSAGAIKKEPW